MPSLRCVLLFGATLLAPFAPAHALTFVTQSPCTPGATGFCTTISAGATATVTVRSLTFSLPSAKTVSVQFNGSMLCTNNALKDAVVDLASQIRTDTNKADANGSGGQRYSMVLKDSPDHIFNTTFTLNMASTRVISFSSGGSKTVRLMLTPGRMDPDTSCGVLNATLSVSIP